MSKLTEQITVHFTKDTYNDLKVESERREGKVGARVSTTTRQLVEERLEQLEQEDMR